MTDTPERTAGSGGDSPEPARPRLARGLSARLLLLTIVFVMLGEVVIYVPSISNFRINWLRERLAAAHIASLVLEATPDQMVSEELRRELLADAGALTIAVRRSGTRRLVLQGDEIFDVDAHYDLRDPMVIMWIWDAFEALAAGDGRIIRVVDAARRPGSFIEIVVAEAPLRAAMIRYSVNILTLSIVLSILTAALVFLTLNWFMVRPIRRLTRNMIRFSQDPENPERIVRESGRADEIGIAEHELARMQRELAATLNQKNHLAALGLAVSKISHDLRNMLTSAQLMSDRLSAVDDPTVRRLAPKLLTSLDRAIAFCAQTLKYGRAQEAPPHRERIMLAEFVAEVFETVGAQVDPGAEILWKNAVPAGLQIDADREQLFRILMNLLRNAADALESAGAEVDTPTIQVSARRDGAEVTVEVRDNGPGVPEKARQHLFEAFQGSARPGGTGLGLAIAAELTRAHGGRIGLLDSDRGAVFEIVIPDRVAAVGGHATRQSA